MASKNESGDSGRGQGSKPTRLERLSTELREEEHAARVQAYGEADAATYEERIAEALRYREAQSGPPAPVPPAPITEAELAEIERGWAKEGEGAAKPPTDKRYDPAEFARSGGS